MKPLSFSFSKLPQGSFIKISGYSTAVNLLFLGMKAAAKPGYVVLARMIDKKPACAFVMKAQAGYCPCKSLPLSLAASHFGIKQHGNRIALSGNYLE